MPRISVRIKDGKIFADFTGYRGSACEADAKKLLEALSRNFDVEASVQRKHETDETSVPA